MLFNSYVFCLAFFPVVLLGYYALNYTGRFTLSKAFLLLASLFFYGYFRPSYLWIICSSILINYGFSVLFERTWLEGWKRKLVLTAALAFNLGVIGYYKYFDFLVSNFNAVFSTQIGLLNVVMPLGISFFTFQQISFVVDCYKKDTPHYALLDYALFVSYFPQLIAGPIVTHDELVPQLTDRTNKRFDAESFSKGMLAFSFGLAKKVLIADTMGNAVNWGFSNVAALSSSDALVTMLAYTFQIYFDFSGYCDMATGIGLMMNIKLPINFNSPYRSLSITEFWKRWHITLTRFFTRYLYIPLGGNRKGKVRMCLNILIVYLCSGIWHGANWTFILWGGIHGIACVVDRLTQKWTRRWHPALMWLLTFLFVNVTWVYFRADSITQANQLLRTIGTLQFAPVNTELLSQFYTKPIQFLLPRVLPYAQTHAAVMPMIVMCVFFLFAWISSMNMKNTNERIESYRPGILTGTVVAVLFSWSVLSFAGVSTFLYFNF